MLVAEITLLEARVVKCKNPQKAWGFLLPEGQRFVGTAQIIIQKCPFFVFKVPCINFGCIIE
jgi:hypothetical protein